MQNKVADLLTFELLVGEFKSDKDKTAFPVFTGFLPNGKKITVKFKRELTSGKSLPKQSGMIKVKTTDMSIDKSKKYPTLWLHDYESIEERVFDNTSALEEFFGTIPDKK